MAASLERHHRHRLDTEDPGGALEFIFGLGSWRELPVEEHLGTRVHSRGTFLDVTKVISEAMREQL